VNLIKETLVSGVNLVSQFLKRYRWNQREWEKFSRAASQNTVH